MTETIGSRSATSYAEPGQLRDALLSSGLLVPAGPDGLYHRSGVFEDVLRAVESLAARRRTDATAPRLHFPPVMAREVFMRTDYVRSFPDLIGSVDVFTGGDREHRALLGVLEDGGPWTDALDPAEVVLSSSVCHQLYATVPREVPVEGYAAECSGFSFRHEPSLDPARMQCFRMYEFVLIGTPDQALAHRDQWLETGLDLLGRLGLPVRAAAANDPFFGRAGRMLAANQVESALKYEVVMDLTDAGPTALASANYHEDHFGGPFELVTPDGRCAHSACFGFGLERITLSLVAMHGTDPTTWPADVRRELGA